MHHAAVHNIRAATDKRELQCIILTDAIQTLMYFDDWGDRLHKTSGAATSALENEWRQLGTLANGDAIIAAEGRQPCRSYAT